MQHTCFRARGNHKLSIHRDQNGDIWVQATWTFDSQDDTIVEQLFCEDMDKGIFLLTSRVIKGNVSITEAARRHTQFPIHCRVRLDPCC